MKVVDLRADHGHETFGDLNGPLPYWGPSHAPVVTPKARRAPAPASRAVGADLTQLSRTLNGRTWSGTNRLMTLVLGDLAAAA